MKSKDSGFLLLSVLALLTIISSLIFLLENSLSLENIIVRNYYFLIDSQKRAIDIANNIKQANPECQSILHSSEWYQNQNNHFWQSSNACHGKGFDYVYTPIKRNPCIQYNNQSVGVNLLTLHFIARSTVLLQIYQPVISKKQAICEGSITQLNSLAKQIVIL
jgi:hypothetical protein